jgi:hypothetical protein
MSTALLKKFFELAKDDDKKCSICLDYIKNFSDSYITFNCCAYIFHEECIKKSFNQVSCNCPMCNEELLIKDTKDNEEMEETECDSECENYSQNEIFLINFTHIHTCNCSSCKANTFYYKLKFAIENDNLDEYNKVLDELDLYLADYDIEYTEKIFLYAIENNSYSILDSLIKTVISEYPDTEEALELFHELAETKNYTMIRFLVDSSIDYLPELIGYNDPELNCILQYN